MDGTALFDLPLSKVANNDGWRIRWSELYRVLRDGAPGVFLRLHCHRCGTQRAKSGADFCHGPTTWVTGGLISWASLVFVSVSPFLFSFFAMHLVPWTVCRPGYLSTIAIFLLYQFMKTEVVRLKKRYTAMIIRIGSMDCPV